MQSKVEQRVMAGVHTIHMAKRLVGVTALKWYGLVLSTIGLSAFVSIPHVASNFVNVAQGGVGSAFIFIVSAILGTTLVVQCVLAIGAAATISLVVPVFRGGRAFA